MTRVVAMAIELSSRKDQSKIPEVSKVKFPRKLTSETKRQLVK
jgi:hypothetical protein